VLVIACGALVRELRAVAVAANLGHVDFRYLPAKLHNRPDKIVPGIIAALDTAGGGYSRVLIGYGDCGTGGALDAAIDQLRAERGLQIDRLPGNHCYEFFSGTQAFAELHEEELGTLFLTDYLTRNFDLLIWRGMGLADHPELLPLYFGNYRRLVLLSQSTDSETVSDLVRLGREAATRLGLTFQHRPTGLDPFSHAVTSTQVELSSAEAS